MTLCGLTRSFGSIVSSGATLVVALAVAVATPAAAQRPYPGHCQILAAVATAGIYPPVARRALEQRLP